MKAKAQLTLVVHWRQRTNSPLFKEPILVWRKDNATLGHRSRGDMRSLISQRSNSG